MTRILAAAALAAVCVTGLGRGARAEGDGSIIAYGRENNSGTYVYFKEHVLGNEDFSEEVQSLPGTAAVINAVSKDPNGIGYGGIGYVKGVKALKVKKDASSPAVEPTLENVVSGAYPISRSLYLYTAGAPDASTKAFIDWTTSEEGQKVCEVVNYYPIPKDKWTVAPSSPGKATITLKGSDTMVIIGQRWAEVYMKAHPEVVIQVTGGGSGTGIAALINGTTTICMASRAMKDKERAQLKEKQAKDAVEFAVALDGIAIFVNESNAIAEVSLEELKAIFTGKTTEWTDLGPAR